jgi:hypothetical protein
MATLDVRTRLLTCECGGTWWETHRQIQVFGGETIVGYRTTASDSEPSAYAVRSVLTCVSCGTVAPYASET